MDKTKNETLMISNLETRQKQIIEEFQKISNWEDKYRRIIQWGKELPDLDEKLKTEESKVKGCQSQVWLHAYIGEDGRIVFSGDSDALIVRGLVALLLKLYSHSTPLEILNTAPTFIKEIGFEKNLSPSRANGLSSMVKQIRNFAIAFSYAVSKD